jgi:glycosyltransferase involved in cell wall biosynthesis
MPAISLKAAVMSAYQRWQLFALGRAADVVFFSIEAWAERFRSWFPRQTVRHLPVSSNIPHVTMHRAEARARLSLDPATVALGMFGTARGGRMLGHIKQAAERLHLKGLKACVVYVGPDGATVRQALSPIPILDCGALGPVEVSQTFAAFDIYLAPFMDGVSTRRTNFMTALQHGCAIVATRGPLTDSMLLKEHERACLLTDVTSPEEFANGVLRVAEDWEMRERLGQGARGLFEREFAWPRVVARLKKGLAATGVR